MEMQTYKRKIAEKEKFEMRKNKKIIRKGQENNRNCHQISSNQGDARSRLQP